MKAETFELAMSRETSYREAEYAASSKGDYQAAEFFHKMRWKCMDAAVKSLEEQTNG